MKPACVALAFAVGWVPGVLTPAAGQDVMTVADWVGLPSPAPDHRIAYGTADHQFGHLWLPEGDGPHPVIIFFHGGCWLPQFDVTHTALVEQGLAHEGFAVWSVEYARPGQRGGGWPGTYQDVAHGADHVRTLAPPYNLDLTRVIASGHSAGGHFALWLAARRKLPPSSPLHRPDPVDVHGVFALAPAPDLEGLHASGVCGGVIDRLMGGSPNAVPERYRDASLMRLAPLNVNQALVIGGFDQTWAPVGRRYYEHAVAQGDRRVHIVDAPASGHFEMTVPSTSTWSVIQTTLHTFLERLPR